MKSYRLLAAAISEGMLASVHGIYRGGLAVHAALMSLAGGLGVDLNCEAAPGDMALTTEALLFSESAGRFLLTVDPKYKRALESHFAGLPLAQIGTVIEEPRLLVNGVNREPIINLTLPAIKAAWQKTFGDLL
jgi:phosphoribosylformylglycinamidine synthase